MKLEPLLTIQNLSIQVSGKILLQDISLSINRGELHILKGENGAGKSTLAHFLVGKPGYQATKGNVRFKSQNLSTMLPEQRLHAGLFMAFQTPITLPGINNLYFLRTAISETRKGRGLDPWPVTTTLKKIKEAAQIVDLDASFLKRALNDDFSGGEKKKNELLQMMLLEPELVILDETDSGLDEQGRQTVQKIIQKMKRFGCSFLMITHYASLLENLIPNKIHTMHDGQISTSDLT